MTAHPFSMLVFQESPGAWRWVFCDARGVVLASSKSYASAVECLHDLTLMQSCAPAFG